MVANTLQNYAFQAAWLPAAGAALDYGATYWAFLRAQEGMLDFIQHAIFPTKAHFERYWYSEQLAQARAETSGLYQVPILPTLHHIVGSGTAAPAPSAG